MRPTNYTEINVPMSAFWASPTRVQSVDEKGLVTAFYPLDIFHSVLVGTPEGTSPCN